MYSTVVLKAISEPTRMRMLELLLHRRYCVRALARQLELSESAVSQHLKVLKAAGVVQGKKLGYHMHYVVDRELLRKEADSLRALTEQESGSCRVSCDAFEPAHCKHIKES